MGEIAPTVQPQRPRRKKPQVPSPLYEPKGHRSTIKGVSRIYLADIERIYDVMEAFVPFSPWAQRVKRVAKLVGDEIPRPIQIETSEYEPAYSL